MINVILDMRQTVQYGSHVNIFQMQNTQIYKALQIPMISVETKN